ncbi:MAG: DUF1905 domain-containing protein [Candidatus Geothermarchaeales archaeon]
MVKRFSATIRKVGVNPCVDVPRRVSEAFARRGYVPVLMTLRGLAFRATLVPTGGGRHRLYINDEMRRKADVDVGARIRLALELDTEPRTIPMPEELALALKRDKTAELAWERLRPSHRRDVLAYLNSLKRPESLARNIEKLMGRLLSEEGWATPPFAARRRWKPG